MSRLIDADALCEDLMNRWSIADTRKEELIRAVMADIVTPIVVSQPTIVPERKRGRWKQVEVNYLADMDEDMKESMAIASMFCPSCKRYHNEVYLYGNPTDRVNFCPNCGSFNGGKDDD